MLRVDVSTDMARGLARDMQTGVRRFMRDAADHGFMVSQDLVPVGATSGLKMSGAEPGWIGDSIVWGYTAPYGPDVEEGQPPHRVEDMDALQLWARRVLGNEAAAGPVAEHIEEEGTDPQPFVQPGAEAQEEWMRQHRITSYVEDERPG